MLVICIKILLKKKIKKQEYCREYYKNRSEDEKQSIVDY